MTVADQGEHHEAPVAAARGASARGAAVEAATVWSALAGALLAVAAWAACCVAPMALSLAGLGVVGAGALAGQRTLLTLGACALLAGGWWTVWRRRRDCAGDGRRPRSSPWAIAVLSVASVLVLTAFAWRPLIEPWALHLILAARR